MMVRRTEGDGLIFSLREFDLLWEQLDAGEPPYPLDIPSHGVTLDERADLRREVLAELRYRSLAGPDGPSEQLADVLTVLTKPERTLDLLVLGTESLRAIAGTGTRFGVFAAQDEQEIAVEPIENTELTAAMVNVIGPGVAGPGNPVSVPRETYSQAMAAHADGDMGRFEHALASAGVTGSAVRPVQTMLSSERYVAGQFAANGPGGRSSVLNWVDTADGRYAMAVSTPTGNEPLVTVTPASPRWLTDQLTSLLAEVS